MDEQYVILGHIVSFPDGSSPPFIGGNIKNIKMHKIKLERPYTESESLNSNSKPIFVFVRKKYIFLYCPSEKKRAFSADMSPLTPVRQGKTQRPKK